jgi:UDP-glucose 4-epimerase
VTCETKTLFIGSSSAENFGLFMHFAAYAYVAESNIDPMKYYDNNIGETARLFHGCAAFECKNVIFCSSCATFGIPSHLPLTEAAAQHPVSPYGYTKLVVERMLRDAEAAHGTRHVALRYFNAAGADPDGELGEMHDPETHLIPLALLYLWRWVGSRQSRCSACASVGCFISEQRVCPTPLSCLGCHD